MMTISMTDFMTNILTILTMMIRLTMMVTLVCMALLGQMTLSCIMISMALMAVEFIVSLGAL